MMPCKILLAWLAVFVMLPAGAEAVNTPDLTYPTGTRLATKSNVKASSIGAITFTGSAGNVSCTSAAPTGTLDKNSGSELEASLNGFSLTGSGPESRCTGASSETYVSVNASCLRSTPEMIEDEFQIRGASCSEASSPLVVTFKKLTPAIECVYQRTAALTGSFATHPEDAIFTVTGAEFAKVSGSIVCFSTFKLDSSFTFEKNEAGVNPLYISGGPTLTFPTGTKLAAEGKVRGHTIGSITLTSSGGASLMQCQAGETTGTLRKNTGTELEADIESASYTGTGTEETCTSSIGSTKWTFNPSTNGMPWCLKASSAMAADEFQIRGNSCAGEARPIRIIAETTAPATTCSYERKAAVTGTYTTHPEDAILSFGNAVLLESEPRKESCVDETQMDASFTLERDEAGTHPMYID